MDPILLVFSVLALVAFTALCIVAILWIADLKKQIQRTVNVIEVAGRDMQDVKFKLLPVLDEARKTLEQASETFAEADEAIEKIGKGADTFVAIADDVRRLERHIVDRIQGPLDDVTNVVSGVMKGVSTFARQLFKR